MIFAHYNYLTNTVNAQTARLKPLKIAAQRAWVSKQAFKMPGQAWTWQEPEESGQSITQEQPEIMHSQKHNLKWIWTSISHNAYWSSSARRKHQKEQVIEQKCLCYRQICYKMCMMVIISQVWCTVYVLSWIHKVVNSIYFLNKRTVKLRGSG